MTELLPRPLRLALGATSRGIGDGPLRRAVEGKVVLVTGASSGVGEATAERLAAAGATVLLVARRVELLETLRERIAAAGGTAFVHACDLADADQVAALSAAVLAQHGHVDVVVSNAGISIRRWISESYDRPRDFERTIDVNYLGPVRLLLGLLPSMRERGGGQIVNIATLGVDFPPMRWSAYIASKAAFETWLAGVAPEIRADGVATTSIHLQLVRSPMLGPFRIWNYVPGMSTEEAAGIVARAIVERPRTIAPLWARLAGPFNQLAQLPLELALAEYAGSGAGEALLKPLRLTSEALGGATTIAASGVVRPVRPDRIGRALVAARRYGATPAAAAGAAAALHGDRPAVLDELGELSFSELDRQARALAAALHHHFDVRAGQRVGIMCRNHRGYVQAAVAATRLGCDLVPLNTEFAAPQLGDVMAREGIATVVLDEEFGQVLEDSGFAGTRIVAWHEHQQAAPTLDALIELGGDAATTPREPGRIILLTSGTTGTPKGATRSVPARALAPLALAGLLDLSRFKPTPRSGEPIVVAPPLFHMYGTLALMGGFALGSPIVITRRFKPESTLELIDRHRAATLLAVPTMLARITQLPSELRERYDATSLRMIISGAAPLSPELARAVMDAFGEILYNGYASTEVGAGTIATPADLRAAPGTVGRPMAGVTVRILDDEGLSLPAGSTGRIFVGSPLLFDGYTGGGSKQVIDGLMSTGDVGHFDAAGRLFVDGRDDDMILSGGENVFPQEVEELLDAHQAVADAAVFGVSDPDFGQRLAAMVVLAPGASVNEDELKAHVKAHLARHKVPREIAFVDEIPRNAIGKLQRRKLAALHGHGG
jgi:acyl-CoA synthetase (AMP-forming)/AMP-acid ligase II/NAD(P)-dependent dehydrogenase (short-subunit alcohol dehydrogenase family)